MFSSYSHPVHFNRFHHLPETFIFRSTIQETITDFTDFISPHQLRRSSDLVDKSSCRSPTQKINSLALPRHPRALERIMTILSMENNSPCLCFGCGARILDRWLLCVSPDLQWHTSCLKCSECGQQLDEKCTCFMRNGKAFCKPDFMR